MQDDNLFAYSTVNETLMFAASLRLPSSMSLEDKQAHVDTVIGKLGLTPARDVIIGGPKARGVSGGERKRVTIGVELLHNPPLVFLDEPTSGLDSFQAQSVMETLQNLASNGHTVVCSIHQPRSSIYAMVDSLMLLAGGRCAYYGPSGSLCHSYFAGLNHPVPEDFNPADHLLDVISVDYRTKEQEGDSKARVDTIVRSWQTSGSGAILSHRGEAAAAAGKHVDQESHALALQPETAHMMQTQTIEYAEKHGGRGASCCTAFPLLLTRTWRELTRNKAELALQIFMNMFFSALFGKQACLFVARACARACRLHLPVLVTKHSALRLCVWLPRCCRYHLPENAVQSEIHHGPDRSALLPGYERSLWLGYQHFYGHSDAVAGGQQGAHCRHVQYLPFL